MFRVSIINAVFLRTSEQGFKTNLIDTFERCVDFRSESSVYIADCGTRMFKATGSLRNEMPEWVMRMQRYLQQSCVNRTRRLNEKDADPMVEFSDYRCSVCGDMSHPVCGYPICCPCCDMPWHHDCLVKASDVIAEHLEIDVDADLHQRLRSEVIKHCFESELLSFHRVVCEDSTESLLCHWCQITNSGADV